jgi:hypothetical protein
MSTVTYRYEQNNTFVKKGIKHTIKESVIDGEYMTVFFLQKIGEDFYQMNAKEVNKDKFEVKEKKGDKETTSEIDIKELVKKLKEFKLDNIINYISKERGTYKGGAKKISKKVSKKPTKKSSKKPTKKSSKKTTKK